MATTIKILITILLVWQVVKRIAVLTTIGAVDMLYSKSNKVMTRDISKRLDQQAGVSALWLLYWLVASTLMIIGTWVYL